MLFKDLKLLDTNLLKIYVYDSISNTYILESIESVKNAPNYYLNYQILDLVQVSQTNYEIRLFRGLK